MRALHLPGVADGASPPFRFPDKPASPADLQYTAEGYPEPQEVEHSSQHTYLIRTRATALTRGEISWQEILERSRFHVHGGAIPGHDLVGTIEKVYASEGASGSPPRFVVGDKVWALLDFDRDGAAATFALARESELSLAPSDPSGKLAEAEWDENLATLPLSALTAFQALFTHGNLPLPSPATSEASPSRRVLITGAAGSVGLPAIYLAKACGFAVVATCSAASTPTVASLLHDGDHIIDYTASSYKSLPESFTTQKLEPADLVVDCTGGTTLSTLLLLPEAVIKPGGKVVTIVAPVSVFGETVAAQISQAGAAANITTEFFIVKPSGDELNALAHFVTSGKLVPHVDAVFDLADGREAMERVESRGRKGGGKVVLRVR